MRYKRIAIIAAMESEVAGYKKAFNEYSEQILAGANVYTGQIGDHDIILMQCGVGMVSAALGCQAIITAFSPDCVINTGSAGALSPELELNDVVVGTKSAQWDMNVEGLDWPRGFISSLNGVYADADPELTQLLEEEISAYNRVKKGLIVSGDTFVASEETRQLILKYFPDALCTEMEGAAIGHVCVQNKVPYAIVRAISDSANSDSTMDYAQFAEAAGEKSARMIIEMLTNN